MISSSINNIYYYSESTLYYQISSIVSATPNISTERRMDGNPMSREKIFWCGARNIDRRRDCIITSCMASLMTWQFGSSWLSNWTCQNTGREHWYRELSWLKHSYFVEFKENWTNWQQKFSVLIFCGIGWAGTLALLSVERWTLRTWHLVMTTAGTWNLDMTPLTPLW